MMIKSVSIRIFKLIIIILSFWFIGEKFWEHLDWLKNSALNIKLLIVVFISSIIYGLSEFVLSFAWRRLLIWCGHQNISSKICHAIYGKSQIAKYVPGNVFHVVSRHILGKQAGIKHFVLAGATVYEILGLISMSVIIGFSGMVIFGLGNIYFSIFQMTQILLIIIFLSGLVPVVVPYLLRLKGISLPYKKLLDSFRCISLVYLSYFIFFFIAGLLLVSIVSIFLNINLIICAKIIAIFSIAWLAGFIIPGAPGGIGVREAVIIFFISPIIGEPQSIAVSIALRIVTLLGDVWFFVISEKTTNFKQIN